VLHHDGRFTHEGHPIENRRLREHFDRSVAFLPDEGKFVVCLRHFRGEVQVEEAGFFVRAIDLESAEVVLSDGTREPLEVASLHASAIDGALLCSVKRSLAPEGLLARFGHAAQAELLQAVELEGERAVLPIGGRREPLPEL
jgi:hypothetical protein